MSVAAEPSGPAGPGRTGPAEPGPGGRLLRGADRALMVVERATAWIGGAVIFALMLLVSAEVVLRRLFNAPIPGQQDITILSMVAFGLLCVSYCYRQAGHIQMDLIVSALSGRPRWILNLFITAAALFTITAIWPGTWTHFLRAYNFGDTTFGIGLPTWPSKLAAPIGLGILWVRLVLEVFVYARLIAHPGAEPIGAPLPGDPKDEMDA